MKKNSNKLLNKNVSYFKTLQGTDGNEKVLSLLENYLKPSRIPLRHATYKIYFYQNNLAI